METSLTRPASAFPVDYFTVEASRGRAGKLHRSYRGLLRDSILFCLDSAAEGLGCDLQPLLARYRGLDPTKKFGPALFAAQSELSDALQSGEVTRVLDALHELWVLPSAAVRDTKFRVESVLTDRWEPRFLHGVRANAPHDAEQGLLLRPLVCEPLDKHAAAVEEALALLAEADPALRAEFSEFVTRLKLFAGRGVYGFTTPTAFGAIFLKVPADEHPVEYFLEHLVHELSHLTLNVLMAHDPLLTNPHVRQHSPLRQEARPLFQVLHATYVLGRCVHVFRHVVAKHRRYGFDGSLRQFEAQFADGLQAVRDLARLTPAGAHLLDSLSAMV